jgi:hypothetical protein
MGILITTIGDTSPLMALELLAMLAGCFVFSLIVAVALEIMGL